ncbi:MAG TPA: bifunctional [glutamine synthetase] adenylyltransferase/[glutamine synthetase]-adenylyl-L-tyrosine phosphorylase [Acidimicrobiales bacterium]|nr:bifunctional [glutamine synthetase] adenylyltransferase/[glutamine synthetase]-adenylyl-L-tyrosine phosphorylase [Acidimicrobiales bacterium]
MELTHPGAADLASLAERSADPRSVRTALDRLDDDARRRVASSPELAVALVTVVAASRSATRLVEADPLALDVLARLDDPTPLPVAAAADPDALVRAKRLAQLRITARDLLGADDLEETTAALADLAAEVLEAAVRLARPDGDGSPGLAVIGMGKLGGRELNYASDIDVLFVEGDPRTARSVLDVTRRCYRVDANLRPEGRDGAISRSLASYVAYWERWAQPWEFQALIKAVPVAGNAEAGAAWAEAAAAALWERRWSADDLRSLRALKARAEAEVARHGAPDLELKRGPGGLRDIEFSVQMLQLVHGGADPELRSPTTLVALGELARGGYVADDDAEGLAEAYRFLRRTEHALQIEDDQQTHTVPAVREHRRRIARVLGYRGTPQAGATEAFDHELARRRNLVRRVHERLYFRPLLDALAGAGELSPEAAAAALTRFGFTDVERTRAAVRELTRGLTRSSRMMQQLLPLLLDWLSTAPDPDLGLLGLRKLTAGDRRATALAHAFRDSPDVAQRLCQLLGTSALLGEVLGANPDLIPRLADAERLRTLDRPSLVRSAHAAVSWRPDLDERQRALRRWRGRHLLGVAARDVFDEADVATVGADLTAQAEACVETALAQLDPQVPFAVVAMGRFAGAELSYASDLDVLFVHDARGGRPHGEGLRLAGGVLRFLGGSTPAHRIYAIDATLRPEGRQGELARSLVGYRAYLDRWAQTWERQALARARPVAGDPDLGRRFLDLLAEAVWQRPFTPEHEREIRRMKARIERERIPPGEDPEFHLKLGRGSLSDVEWTVQLLQLRAGIRLPSTMGALDALEADGAIDPGDADILRTAYRFCERTRNRWWLVGSAPTTPDSLPARPDDLLHLARSLDTTPGQLREDHRRVTRRARRVMERLFYGTG